MTPKASRAAQKASVPALQVPPSTQDASVVTLFPPHLITESVTRGAFSVSADAKSVASGTKSVGAGASLARGQSGKRRA
jgi:hypothetical protein